MVAWEGAVGHSLALVTAGLEEVQELPFSDRAVHEMVWSEFLGSY